MSKCENCIHYECCCDWVSSEDLKALSTSENCATYKAKSLFVELPCKVGDKVYTIEICHCYNTYAERCNKRRTKATRWIEIIKLPTKHHTKCVKLFERDFKIEYLHKIGKTVFLTKEDAEKKLRELGVWV